MLPGRHDGKPEGAPSFVVDLRKSWASRVTSKEIRIARIEDDMQRVLRDAASSR